MNIHADLPIVRASAWYDCVTAPGFATPWTVALVLAGMDGLSGALGLRDRVPAFAPARLLYATWQLYALAHGAHPLTWAFVVFEVLFGIAEALPVKSPGAK